MAQSTSARGGILADRQIRAAVDSGELVIDPFEPDCVQPATYDLRIGPLLYSPVEPDPDHPVDLSRNGGTYRIPPYANALLMTYETLKLPRHMVGRIGLKSGLARKGLLASTGPQVDPGFEGKLFVSLHNLTPISHLVQYQDTFLTIEFHKLEQPAEKLYEGPYQGKTTATKEMLEDLLRLEGLNLSQMQTQFTELTQHVKTWSSLATRFDDFLSQMSAQTAAVAELARQLSEIMLRLEPQAIEARDVDVQQAMDEILNLFKERKRLFYSDIAETLRLDFATVIEACEELQRRGLIEGEMDGQEGA